MNNDVRLETDCLNELERIKVINTAENPYTFWVIAQPLLSYNFYLN